MPKCWQICKWMHIEHPSPPRSFCIFGRSPRCWKSTECYFSSSALVAPTGMWKCLSSPLLKNSGSRSCCVPIFGPGKCWELLWGLRSDATWEFRGPSTHPSGYVWELSLQVGLPWWFSFRCKFSPAWALARLSCESFWDLQCFELLFLCLLLNI